jgi:hypothetical protein
MTPTQEYLDRYKEIVKEADTLGRVIGVGRLRLSQQIKIQEMTPGLDGEIESTGPDGNPITISRRVVPIFVASVREIDGHPVMFPRNRAELDSIMDRLDEPGLIAVIKATERLSFSQRVSMPEENVDGMEGSS